MSSRRLSKPSASTSSASRPRTIAPARSPPRRPRASSAFSRTRPRTIGKRRFERQDRLRRQADPRGCPGRRRRSNGPPPPRRRPARRGAVPAPGGGRSARVRAPLGAGPPDRDRGSVPATSRPRRSGRLRARGCGGERRVRSALPQATRRQQAVSCSPCSPVAGVRSALPQPTRRPPGRREARRSGSQGRFAKGVAPDDIFAESEADALSFGDRNGSVRIHRDWRRDDFFGEVALRGGYIAGHGKTGKGGEMDVVGAPDAALQHAAAPRRNPGALGEVGDVPRRGEPAYPAGLDV